MPTNSPTRSDVAVIVPCHNVEGFLKRALDTVFAQTYRDFCIYAVDDGSTDNTARILKAYSHRCISIYQAHAGPAAARNRGIRASESPFIAFLDADDEWLPQKLESQIAMLKRDPKLGMVCSFCKLGEEGDNKIAHNAANDRLNSGRLFQHLARNCFVFTPTVVVRRECLEDVGLFEESLIVSEDFNLWLRIAGRWRIAVVPEFLAITHKRRDSLSARIATEERLRSGVAALEHVQANCPGLSRPEERALRLALSQRFYFYGSYLLATGQAERSREKLTNALRHQPAHWRAIAKLALSFLPKSIFASLVGLRRT